jgi:hypothetical protein
VLYPSQQGVVLNVNKTFAGRARQAAKAEVARLKAEFEKLHGK